MASTKRKHAQFAKPRMPSNAKAPSRMRIDESRSNIITGAAAPVTNKAEPIEISSDSSSACESGDDDEGMEDAETSQGNCDDKAAEARTTEAPSSARIKHVAGSNTVMHHGDHDPETEVPTIGDLIRASTTVDASALVPATAPSKSLAPNPASLSSLGTVLNQALRTDDVDLLESCLVITDHDIIFATIQRVESALAPALLNKLAVRIHRRPGRALGLMKWVQLTLITHGGALAAVKDLMGKLGELNRVLEERARGLPSLLKLKGKLDMLDAQLKARKANRGRVKGGRKHGLLMDRMHEDGDDEGGDEDDEGGVVYVEGQEAQKTSAAGEEEKDDVPLVNGLGDSDEEESDEDEDGADEEEEVDEEELNEGAEDVDHEDVEESDDDSNGDAARPPTKVRKVGAAEASKKR